MVNIKIIINHGPRWLKAGRYQQEQAVKVTHKVDIDLVKLPTMNFKCRFLYYARAVYR